MIPDLERRRGVWEIELAELTFKAVVIEQIRVFERVLASVSP